MPTTIHHRHPASQAVPLLEVAAALGLTLSGKCARCFNGAGHQNGVDRHPSLNLGSASGRYHCYACGVSGDAIDLVRGVLGLDFCAAVTWLEELAAGRSSAGSPIAHVRAPRPDGRIREVYERLYEWTDLPDSSTPAGAYLLKRSLDPLRAGACGAREVGDPAALWRRLTDAFDAPTLAAAGLTAQKGGYLFARHRLLFFYLDGGRPAFVQARDITGTAKAKELLPAGVSCPLPFQRDLLRNRPPVMYVCEGCIDTLSAKALGLPAVGIPGVHAFRDDWFDLFRGVGRVVVLFDADEAGQAQGAALRTRFRLPNLEK